MAMSTHLWCVHFMTSILVPVSREANVRQTMRGARREARGAAGIKGHGGKRGGNETEVGVGLLRQHGERQDGAGLAAAQPRAHQIARLARAERRRCAQEGEELRS